MCTLGGLQSGTTAATTEERAAKLYSLLELGLEATPDDVRTAYRRLARMWHPDRHRGGDPVAVRHATLRFQEIAAAYEVLIDPERRIAYDLGLLELLDVEEYLKRFQDLTLTASGLGMSSRARCPPRPSSSFSASSASSSASSSSTFAAPDGLARSSSCWQQQQQRHHHAQHQHQSLAPALFRISLSKEPGASPAAASGGAVAPWPSGGPLARLLTTV